MLKEVEDSAAPGLKERARGTVDMSLNEARTALKKTIELVRETINTEQKEVSRLLSPHVMNQLAEGYDLAMMERGTGSVARQKVSPTPLSPRNRTTDQRSSLASVQRVHRG